MTGNQMFILIFLLGGTISGAIFLIGLGIYYWGRGKFKEGKHNDNN